MENMEHIRNSEAIKRIEIKECDPNEKLSLDKAEFTTQWISQSEFDETESESSSIVYSSSLVESEDCIDDMNALSLNDKRGVTNCRETSTAELQKLEILKEVFNARNNVQTFGTVKIENSTGIHIGNVTYITEPVHITDTNGGNVGVINLGNSDGIKLTSQSTQISTTSNQDINISPYNLSKQSEFKNSNGSLNSALEEVEREEVNRSDAFVGPISRSIAGNVLKIVKRRTWLAQVPLGPYLHIEGPVQYVIISHTATELTRTQADTVYLVRHIQCFHIESCRWNDIGYSFMIGGDGNVYEGRGWGIVGAHTYGYNRKSIGISFIGCFMKELPPQESLNACKLLIKRGVELGNIDSNYKLLAHCQCCPTESPGKRLFEEMRTWPHFVEHVESV